MLAVLRSTAAALIVASLPLVAFADEPKTVQYVCAENQTVTVMYTGADKASVTYLGTTYKMKRDKSADGVRYVGKGMQWWTKGEGGFLAGASATHVIAHDCTVKK